MDAGRRRVWLVRGGYAALGTLSFLYFLARGFPVERVVHAPFDALDGRTPLEELERLTGSKVELGTLRVGGLFSAVASDVRLTRDARRGLASGPASGPIEPLVKLDRVKVSLKPLKLLAGRIGLGLSGSAYGGGFSGSVAIGGKSTSVDVEIRNLDLAKYGLLANRFQLNVAGQVGGTVDLLVDSIDNSKSKGRIEITVQNAAIEESKPYGIPDVPKTPFQRGGAAVVVVEDGKAKFENVGIRGDDLELELDGELVLRKSFATSQWSARATIKMSDKLRSAVPLLETFVMPGKGPDGAYRYRLSGILERPQRIPERNPR